MLLADTLLSQPSALSVPARYHRARALERAGNLEEAMLELQHVIELDMTPTRFYAGWAEQRLRELEQPDECRAPGRASDCNREAIEAALAACESAAGLDAKLAIEHLAPLAASYREAYARPGAHRRDRARRGRAA